MGGGKKDTPSDSTEQTPASKSQKEETEVGTVIGYLPPDHPIYSTSRILFGGKHPTSGKKSNPEK